MLKRNLFHEIIFFKGIPWNIPPGCIYKPHFVATSSRIFSYYRCGILNCVRQCTLTSNTIQFCRLVTFETRIAILTIENLNSRQSLLSERVTVDSSRNSCLYCRFSLSLLLAWPWEGWWKFRLVLEKKKAFGSGLKSLVIDISSLFMYCGLINYSAFCLPHNPIFCFLQCYGAMRPLCELMSFGGVGQQYQIVNLILSHEVLSSTVRG